HSKFIRLLQSVSRVREDVAELSINGLARRGIIAAYTLNNPNVIRFEPPLVVTAEQVDTAISAFRESVAEALSFLEGLEE
ncbi:MAG TPA: putrescine aminotransferase, partial [Chthonomonadaceae bacterium]|nr:putrescine aminotransferase [Chthonomonadaceae bacterium]